MCMFVWKASMIYFTFDLHSFLSKVYKEPTVFLCSVFIHIQSDLWNRIAILHRINHELYVCSSQ